MPQIIIKERTAYLASIFQPTRDIDHYKNTSLLQLYQPSTTPFFIITHTTSYFRPVSIAKFLGTALLQITSRSSHLQMFFQIGVLRSLANFTGKHLCWSLFLKNLQVGGLQLHHKRLQQIFLPVKFAKFLRTLFLKEHFQRLLLHLRWLLLFFFKKIVLNSYFATLL